MDEHEKVPRTPPGATLRLRLSSGADGKQPMEVLRQDPPWRVVRAFPTPAGESLVHLHNLSGGILGGDRLQMEVELQAGSRVQLTTTGATRVYKQRDERPAISMNRMRIAAGAVLEFLPDQIIPYSGSVFTQETVVELASKDAGLFWWETVAPGRTASGEMFRYRRLSLRSAVLNQERPIALDRLCLEPERASPRRPGALGHFLCTSMFYICRTGLGGEVWLELERILMDEAESLSTAREIWGASRLVRDGLMVRGLGYEAAEMAPALVRFWSVAKRFLYGREAVPPRKVY